jgi:hypothetical protein
MNNPVRTAENRLVVAQKNLYVLVKVEEDEAK